MIHFNSRHIFTGYIKQLLSSFKLPTYRIYTKEQQQYHDEMLKLRDQLQANIDYINQLLSTEYYIPTENDPDKENKEDAAEQLKHKRDLLQAELDTLQMELHVIPTVYRDQAMTYKIYKDGSLQYPSLMYYVPYLKNNKVVEYVIDEKTKEGKWIDSHANINSEHQSALHTSAELLLNHPFMQNKETANNHTQLAIKNNVYDTHTHEYLGEYLRFMRDYHNLDLMSLYNCFSDRLCTNLNLNLAIRNKTDSTPGYTAKFSTSDVAYKIYMVPVKLFKNYTIAIDCTSPVEMCCGVYGAYFDDADRFKALPRLTYQCFSNTQFSRPQLFTKLVEIEETTTSNTLLAELAKRECDLKLFIKLPIKNTSSITILEGDYTGYNDSLLKFKGDKELTITNYKEKVLTNYNENTGECDTKYVENTDLIISRLIRPFADTLHNMEILTQGYPTPEQEDWMNVLRKCLTYDSNYPYKEALNYYKKLMDNAKDGTPRKTELTNLYNQLVTAVDFVTEKNTALNIKINTTTATNAFTRYTNKYITNYANATSVNYFKPVSPLELLKLNTGKSYPFASRLMEYLTDNAITNLDNIADNIERVKKVVATNINKEIIPNFETNSLWDDRLRPLLYDQITKDYDIESINHDLLGYVDKDVEKYYRQKPIYKTYLVTFESGWTCKRQAKNRALLIDSLNKEFPTKTIKTIEDITERMTIANSDIYTNGDNIYEWK